MCNVHTRTTILLFIMSLEINGKCKSENEELLKETAKHILSNKKIPTAFNNIRYTCGCSIVDCF